jgi:hypothetical protein
MWLWVARRETGAPSACPFIGVPTPELDEKGRSPMASLVPILVSVLSISSRNPRTDCLAWQVKKINWNASKVGDNRILL